MDDIKQLVKSIISESSFKESCSNLTGKIYRRKRNHLSKNLKGKVEKLLDTMQPHEIKEKLTNEINLKYSSGEVKSSYQMIYHDDIDAFVSESENEEEEAEIGEALNNETSENEANEVKSNESMKIDYSNIEETSRKRLSFKDRMCGEHLQDRKRESIFEHTACQTLITQNHFLSQRSKELSKLKLKPHLSSRTISIADAALFSDHVGFPDAVLLDTPVSICESLTESKIARWEMIDVTELHDVCRLLVRNGEYVVLKKLKRSLQYSFEKCLSLLSHEAKILALIKPHKNVTAAFGLALMKGVPSLVLEYQSMETLQDLLRCRETINIPLAKQISSGIGKGLSHLHEEEILHNMLLCENIVLQARNAFFIPVIVGFSWSCRKANAKPLTVTQQSKFKHYNHLPNNVLYGKSAPSEKSDIYAYGMILRKLFSKVKEHSSDRILIEKLIFSCSKGKDFFVNNFLTHVIDVFVL